MLADTDAIRALGATSSTHAADLAAIASTLASLPGPASASMFGPVGASFLAALADAAACEARAAAELSDSVCASCTTAHASATAYDDVDQRVGGQIGGL